MIEAGLVLPGRAVRAGVSSYGRLAAASRARSRTFPAAPSTWSLRPSCWWARSILALGAVGNEGLGAGVFSARFGRRACPYKCRPDNSPSIFAMPGPTASSAPCIPRRLMKGNSNFFGLDPENDIPARDDITSAELVIPVNQEIHLMMHAKDVGHSFYVPANCAFSRISFPGSIFPSISPQPRSASTRLSVPSFAASATTT